jgi:hypothetical protein
LINHSGPFVATLAAPSHDARPRSRLRRGAGPR